MERNELVGNILRSKEFRDAFMFETVKKSVAFQVRQIRRHHALTLRQFAKRVGISYSTAQRLEDAGRNGCTSVKTLLKISSAFDLALIIKFVTYSRWLNEMMLVTPDGGVTFISLEDDLKPLADG